MIKLFKKKESKKKETEELSDLPPLPENLNESETPPKLEGNSVENNNNIDNISNTDIAQNKDNIHDKIPNDFDINQNTSFSPENLPQYEEDQEIVNENNYSNPNFGQNNQNNNLQNIQTNSIVQDNQDFQNSQGFQESQNNQEDNSEDFSLPPLPNINQGNSDLPDLPDINTSGQNEDQENITKDSNNNKEKNNYDSDPTPEIDDDVPEPPAIFSKEGLYETSEEVKEIIDKNKTELFKPTNETTDDYKVEKTDNYKVEKTDSLLKKEDSNKGLKSKENILDEFQEDEVTNNSAREVKNYNDDFLYEEKELARERSSMINRGPIFVNINSFKTMLNGVDIIKEDIRSSEEVLQNLNKIKDLKDKELERWRLQLEDIQRKISYVDKVIFNEA